MKPSLCLNMIVRNEDARIGRCLHSVLPYVKSVCVLDTGSTDATVTVIEKLCLQAGVVCHVGRGEFKDFSQARNEAFALAREVNGKDRMPFCQFALLMDADMELKVDNLSAFEPLFDAHAASFDMIQKSGTISYANRRIVNLDIRKDNIYVGVTHEYIDVPADGMIEGVWFLDHADGSNRVEKYPRDAALLEAALKDDPWNPRYWFYLGNTYRDWGKFEKARDAYVKRVALGGWDEETHAARMNLAACHKAEGREGQFVTTMLEAYNFRPRRAEPLYDLALHHREKGENALALMYAKTGMEIPRPNDVLFVNDFVYSHGLRYEYSISAYYNERERNNSTTVTNELALDPTAPAHIRWSSRTNLFWHTKPLSEICPSFSANQLAFEPPKGYTATNPSVVWHNNQLFCNVRTVNYKIDAQGRYMIGPKECNDAPIDTRNFIVPLDEHLNALLPSEIIWARPSPAWDMVTGLEDIRLNSVNGGLSFSATVREQNMRGVCEMFSGTLGPSVDANECRVTSWTAMSGEEAHEKNWMPISGRKEWMYRLDTVIDIGRQKTKHPSEIAVGDISGSSQLIQFKHGWLAVVHEASSDPDGKRTYWHRFVWFDQNLVLRRISLPFVFFARQIEFCAGLAYDPGQEHLVVSFGVRDEEAWVASLSVEDVAAMVWKLHED